MDVLSGTIEAIYKIDTETGKPVKLIMSEIVADLDTMFPEYMVYVDGIPVELVGEAGHTQWQATIRLDTKDSDNQADDEEYKVRLLTYLANSCESIKFVHPQYVRMLRVGLVIFCEAL